MRKRTYIWLILSILSFSITGCFSKHSIIIENKVDLDSTKQSKEETVYNEKGSEENSKLRIDTYEEIFLRAFKSEMELELWAKRKNDKEFILIKVYPFTKFSGTLGPKRKEGDLQIPEGFYYVDRFNPKSKFCRSLGINYPNKADKVFADKNIPGGDIFIHGGNASIGCIPIGNENIMELYNLAESVRSKGQKKIMVHIFPIKFTKGKYEQLKQEYNNERELLEFWENLKEGYQVFESKHILPNVIVDDKGEYKYIIK